MLGSPDQNPGSQPSYEHFTDRARKAMALANQEAQRANHQYINTEDILLGLLMEGSGVGANVLKSLGADAQKVRSEVVKLADPKDGGQASGSQSRFPTARRVIDTAIEEARNLNHNYVGTEHLLLGLLRSKDGLAAAALASLGLRLEGVRTEILVMLGHDPSPGSGSPAEPSWAGSSSEAIQRLGWLFLRELEARAQRAMASGDDVLAEEYQNIEGSMRALLERLAKLGRDPETP